VTSQNQGANYKLAQLYE